MSNLEFKVRDKVYSLIHGNGEIIEITGINMRVQFPSATGNFVEWYSTSGKWNKAHEDRRHLFWENPLISFKTDRPYEPKYSKDKIYLVRRKSEPDSLIPIQIYDETQNAIWFIYKGLTAINSGNTNWINGYKNSLNHDAFDVVGEY